MSQPPKSTMRAPAARWMALSGVLLSTLSPGRKGKGEAADPLRPVCPFYLRDYGALLAGAGCPFGGPPECAASLQIDSLSLQSSLPERFSGVTPSAAAPASGRHRALLHGRREGYRGPGNLSKTGFGDRLAVRVATS